MKYITDFTNIRTKRFIEIIRKLREVDRDTYWELVKESKKSLTNAYNEGYEKGKLDGIKDKKSELITKIREVLA